MLHICGMPLFSNHVFVLESKKEEFYSSKEVFETLFSFYVNKEFKTLFNIYIDVLCIKNGKFSKQDSLFKIMTTEVGEEFLSKDVKEIFPIFVKGKEIELTCKNFDTLTI